MRCSKAMQQLQLYIDKQLLLEDARMLEVHLAACASCQRELILLEEIDAALQNVGVIAEPPDLTRNIMVRVTSNVQQREKPAYTLFQPSLRELLAAILLATLTTLGVILGQPALSATLPFASKRDALSLAFSSALHTLIAVNGGTLMWAFWLVGTFLGIGITWLLAGDEMRNEWWKAMSDRLSTW